MKNLKLARFAPIALSCVVLLFLGANFFSWRIMSSVNEYNNADVFPGFHDRYRAFGKGCFSMFSPKEGHQRLPVPAQYPYKKFDPKKPITLVLDCTHNAGKFNPFHWSMAVWEFYGFLMNETLAIQEAVVPCSPSDFNLDSKGNSWIEAYWPAVLEKLKERNIPLRFTYHQSVCLDNMVYVRKNEKILAKTELMDAVRSVAYKHCGFHPDSDSRQVPSDSVAILTRPDSRTFSRSDVTRFTAAAQKKGFNVSLISIPKLYCDQIKLFGSKNFKYLLTPHGAQLTNALFLPRDSVVIEFFPPNFHIAMYCHYKFSTPIQWAQVYSKHTQMLWAPHEISQVCEDPGKKISPCQHVHLCRTLAKKFRTKMYDPEAISDFISNFRRASDSSNSNLVHAGDRVHHPVGHSTATHRAVLPASSRMRKLLEELDMS